MNYYSVLVTSLKQALQRSQKSKTGSIFKTNKGLQETKILSEYLCKGSSTNVCAQLFMEMVHLFH